jgi:hypothetical protein
MDGEAEEGETPNCAMSAYVICLPVQNFPKLRSWAQYLFDLRKTALNILKRELYLNNVYKCRSYLTENTQRRTYIHQ